MPDHYESNAFDEQNTEDAAGKPTKGSKKKKKRYNPWGDDATANPENMIPGKP